jgi:hypothetical protein
MHSLTRRFFRVIQAVVLTVLAAQVLAASQGADAKRVLNELRAALGGEDKLAAVKTLSVQGQSARVGPDGQTSSASDFEWAIELPSKFVKREMFANLGGQKLYRRVGFNGPDVIEENDMPAGMTGGGGHMVVRSMGPGSATPGGKATPEQVAAQKAQTLTVARRDFARLTLGMLGSSFDAFPVEFSYAGQAEAPDGKADVLEVRGADGFVAKFFVDGKSRLPLMLSWMDKEPLRMTMGPGGGSMSAGPVQVFSAGGGAAARSPEDAARMQQEMADRMKEAEAKRRIVEYRLFYSDYKAFNGVKLPTRIQRMMDGLPTEELSLENIKVNAKIDAAKFQAGK